MNNKIMRERSEVLVIAHFGRALAERWWQSPNRAFDYKTPSEQWDIDPTRVYNYLMNSK